MNTDISVVFHRYIGEDRSMDAGLRVLTSLLDALSHASNEASLSRALREGFMSCPDVARVSVGRSRKGERPRADRLDVPLSTGDTVRVLFRGRRPPWASSAHTDALAAAIEMAVAHVGVVARVAALSRRAHVEGRTVRQELARVTGDDAIVARSPATRQLFGETVPLLARVDVPVLVRGESGVGKEVVARRVHALSRRSARPFVAVNCGALPATLIDSALFGHERGAFTGATSRALGVFERAHGGTLFLDEIAELSLDGQVRLLRAIQEGEIQRVGGVAPVRVDTRIIAATHRDLHAMVRRGTFREDLYYRLAVVPVVVPPLRERPEDVVELVRILLARLAASAGLAPPAVSRATMTALLAHPFPGNVRELENVLARSLVLSPGKTLVLDDLVSPMRRPDATGTLADASRNAIVAALAQCSGKIYGPHGAAARLALPPSTLQSAMKRLGVAARSSIR